MWSLGYFYFLVFIEKILIKYWYFKLHPRYKEAVASEISHLTFGNQKRGEYVVTNPYDIIGGGNNANMPNFDDIFAAPAPATVPKQPVEKPKTIEDIVVEKENIIRFIKFSFSIHSNRMFH